MSGGEKLIECPRCGEADERALGPNKCGLCECEFDVLMSRVTRTTPKKATP